MKPLKVVMLALLAALLGLAAGIFITGPGILLRTITNFWAIPIALLELLRKGLKFFKPIK